MICQSAWPVWNWSRPSRDSSIVIKTWKGGRGFSACIIRRNPGRFSNSAPLIPSST